MKAKSSSAAAAAVTSAPSAPRFSYRQLTEAQVLGARDRSKRQVECHQLVCQLTQANEKWKRLVDHKNQTSTSISLSHGDIYHRAIVKAFEGGGEPDDDANSFTGSCYRRRELSPIMIARLANLCYHEYYNEQISKGLHKTEEDCRSVHDWYSELLQNEVTLAIERQRELEEQIVTTKEEILLLEKQRHEQMEKSKEYHEQQLIQYKEHLVVRLQQMKEHEQQQNEKQQQEQKKKDQQLGTKGSQQKLISGSNSLGSSNAGSAALQQYQKLLSITSHRNLVPKKKQEVCKQQQDMKKKDEEEEEKEVEQPQSRLTSSTPNKTRQIVSSISNDSSFSCCDWVDVVDSENEEKEEDDLDGDYNNSKSKSVNIPNNNNNCSSSSGGGSDNNRKDGQSSSLSDWIVCS